MKTFFSLIIALSTGLAAHALEVPGDIFYQHPDGHLVERSVTIDLPARGRGEVVLKGEGFEWRSRHFSSSDHHGRKVFVVNFPTEHNGQQSVVTLNGSYIRTSNKVLYYGDVYKLEQRGRLNINHPRHPKQPVHIGGFRFEYDRD